MSDTLVADVPLQPEDPREWKSQAQELRAVETAQRGLPRGYKLPAAARPILTAAAKTDLRRSTLTALGDMALFIGTGIAAAVAHATLPAAAAWALSLVAIVIMGRTGRALECMVHEASHRNWQRQGRWNDLLANVMAGFPTASQVGEYRASHMVHHARLGSDDDPDIIRYEQFDLESMTGLSGTQLVKGVVRRLPAYNWSWYTAIGTSAVTLALSGAWYAVVVGAVALAGGPQLALATWLHMLVAFGLVLPVIRMLGEAGEHRFIAGDTAFNATISNLGWAHRWIIHPHGDGHHSLHHLWSSVPHHQIAKMHLTLAELDKDNFAANIQWRKKVLENVRTGLDA
ncbi:MAG TPA: fatty acid desaturase [Acidimicrobiales bacterium]|nr:fatty acid desaturase [Acidimicrobiales bacterium]